MTLGYSQFFDKEQTKPTHFKEKILDPLPGMYLKVHSIRVDNHDRWKAGRTIHHCYGNRTKQRECFLVNTCVSTQRLSINYPSDGNVLVIIDGRRLQWSEIGELVVNDGFSSVKEFFDWFNKTEHYTLIHWTEKRY